MTRDPSSTYDRVGVVSTWATRTGRRGEYPADVPLRYVQADIFDVNLLVKFGLLGAMYVDSRSKYRVTLLPKNR